MRRTGGVAPRHAPAHGWVPCGNWKAVAWIVCRNFSGPELLPGTDGGPDLLRLQRWLALFRQGMCGNPSLREGSAARSREVARSTPPAGHAQTKRAHPGRRRQRRGEGQRRADICVCSSGVTASSVLQEQIPAQRVLLERLQARMALRESLQQEWRERELGWQPGLNLLRALEPTA